MRHQKMVNYADEFSKDNLVGFIKVIVYNAEHIAQALDKAHSFAVFSQVFKIVVESRSKEIKGEREREKEKSSLLKATKG